ncbi:MAG: hypothetical protein ABI977_34705 [Acidobacteriota bacterium]
MPIVPARPFGQGQDKEAQYAKYSGNGYPNQQSLHGRALAKPADDSAFGDEADQQILNSG